MHSAEAAVLFANEAFYHAFAMRDVAAMAELWAEDAPLACIHPGWNPVTGHEAVLASWRAILESPNAPEIRCHAARAFLYGECAFVICFEEIGGTFLVATNVFVARDNGWKMVHHQAGPASAPPQDAADPPAPRAH
jgi:ketosteroid isomerase-like protein